MGPTRIPAPTASPASLDMADTEQKGRDGDHVVPGILDARQEPARLDFQRGPGLVSKELGEAPDQEDQVDGVEDERPQRKGLLDHRGSLEDQEPHAGHDADDPGVKREGEDSLDDAAAGGGDDRQSQQHHDQVADLVEEPPAVEQLPGEGPVVVGTGLPRQLEGHQADG